MSDWINLDVGNIPSDFFVNERYEIQYYIEETCATHDYWEKCTNKPCERYTYIEGVVEKNIKYRYRLKPLEPIRIDKEFNDLLKRSRHMHGIFMNSKLSYSFSDEVGLIMFNDRPVEIIEE